MRINKSTAPFSVIRH